MADDNKKPSILDKFKSLFSRKMIKNCSHFKILSGKFAKKYQYRCICDRKYKNRNEKEY